MIKHIDLIIADRECKQTEKKKEEYDRLVKTIMVSIDHSLSRQENRVLIQLLWNPEYETYFDRLKKDFELHAYKVNIIELRYTDPDFLWIKGKEHCARYLEISWK